MPELLRQGATRVAGWVLKDHEAGPVGTVEAVDGESVRTVDGGDKMKFKMMNDYVLIEDYGEWVESLILVGYTNESKWDIRFGRVIAVGPGIWLANGVYFKTESKEGDWILYNRHFGTKVTHENRNMILSQNGLPLRVLDERNQVLVRVDELNDLMKARVDMVLKAAAEGTLLTFSP